MSLEHHSLLNDFPEHKEVIHSLKTENNHFRKLFEEYHELDKEIYRAESGDEPTSDDRLEELKKKRLFLKDELYAMIQAN